MHYYVGVACNLSGVKGLKEIAVMAVLPLFFSKTCRQSRTAGLMDPVLESESLTVILGQNSLDVGVVLELQQRLQQVLMDVEHTKERELLH